MKNLVFKQTIVFFTVTLVFINLIRAQENCKVLLDSITGEYEGACKKGLAEGTGRAKGIDTYVGEFKKGMPSGTGKYMWANGNVYEGGFKNGLKDGKGDLTVLLPDGKHKIQTGYWEKNVYIGEYENPYVVTSRTAGVLSCRLTRTENPAGDGNALFIEIAHKGRTQQTPPFLLTETVGSFMSKFPVGMNTKVIVSSFPFGFTIYYMDETIEIKIYQPGSWSINIDYNK